MSLISPEYLAGFIDGDGHFFIAKRRKVNYHIGIAIGNTNFQIIKDIQAQYGGNLVETKVKKGCKKFLKVCYSAKQAEKLLEIVAPFILLKRKQVEILQEFLLIKNGPKEDNYTFFKGSLRRIKPELVEKLSQLKDKMHVLNAVGPKVVRTYADYSFLNNLPEPSNYYTAGFFDAEGRFGISGNSVSEAIMEISNTNLSILEKIQKKFGGILSVTKQPTLREQKAYKLLWRGNTAEFLRKEIGSLIRIKDRQLLVFDNFLELRKLPKDKIYNEGIIQKGLLPSMLDTRLSLKKEMSILNKRGC